MEVRLINDSGIVKKAPVGFSWTTLLFGGIVSIVRGDWKWAIIQILASGITMGISAFVFCFIYNKLYINDLLKEGFKPSDDESRNILVEKGFISA